MTDRRGTFAPVVGLGLGAGILAAVAGARTWATGFDAAPRALTPLPEVSDAGTMPLANTLALVALACWGVVLVTRGRVRRAVAALALVAAAGLVATVVVGFTSVQDRVAEAMREGGAAGDTLGTELTGWYWAAAVAAVLLLATTLLAVAWSPGWPEMGSRYDAPGGDSPDRDAPPGQRSSLDLWKSMDEGRDPTA